MKQHDILSTYKIESTYQIKHKCRYCNYQSGIAYDVGSHIRKKHVVKCRICFKLVGSNHINKHVERVHAKKSNEEIGGKIEYQSTSDIVGMGKQPINMVMTHENKTLFADEVTEKMEYPSTTGKGEQSNNMNDGVGKNLSQLVMMVNK